MGNSSSIEERKHNARKEAHVSDEALPPVTLFANTIAVDVLAEAVGVTAPVVVAEAAREQRHWAAACKNIRSISAKSVASGMYSCGTEDCALFRDA
jgi:hypothetical protein